MDNDRLKRKLAELKTQNSERRALWKPKPGRQQIRIVPYIHSTGWPFVELHFHYNVTTKSMISPFSFGRADPIKDFAEKMQSTGDRDVWKQGKYIEPKRRTYVPILVRGEEDQGVKFWGFGTQIYEALLMKIDDPDWGDITHPLEGRDITVTFEKAISNKHFPKTTIDVKPVKSPVTESPAVLEAMQNMIDVTTLWDEPTYDELMEILEEFTKTGQPVDLTSSERNTQEDDNAGVTEAVTTGAAPVSTSPDEKVSSADLKSTFSKYYKNQGGE